jgi:transposase
VELSCVLLGQIDELSKTIAELEKATVQEAVRGATMRRLQTMPGMGPITAMAIETFAPPMAVFRRGPRLCRLARGCSPATFDGRQAASRQDLQDGPARHPAPVDYRRDGCHSLGLPKGRARGKLAASLLARVPRMLSAIALVNKMARAIWAMLTRGEDYRVPAAAAC